MPLLPKPEMIEVLYGQENIIKTTLIGFQDIEKQLDGCYDHSGPSALFADKEGTIWNALLGLMRRGVRLRYLTQITKDNISYCKEMAKERLEVRHLDGVKGNFGISDRRDCMIYTIQEEGHVPTQIIFTNARSFVEQQQYFFDVLWNKAIPSDQKIREIEEGIVPEFIYTIGDQHEIQKLGFDLITSAKQEILIIFSTANAFLRQRKAGALESVLQQAINHEAKVKILTPINEKISELIKDLNSLREKEIIDIEIRYIESPQQTRVTILVVDRKFSLAVELKDDTKETSYEAIGLGVYSNSKSTVLSYVSIFESLWNQSNLYDQLKSHDKMQKEFINIAAHELRNPIQPILGLSTILRAHKVSIEKYDEALDVIVRNAKRLQRLTEDILDVTKIESNALNLRKEQFNVNEVISNAVQDYSREIQKSNCEIIYRQIQQTKNDVVIEADKHRISQVLSNLIGNAIRFTKDKGVISISVDKQEATNDNNSDDANSSSIIFSIKDNGIGIDPEIISKLFSRFVTKSDKGGTGLGLYISKSIIDAHGGKIWAENNKDGKGATFSFSLPTVVS